MGSNHPLITRIAAITKMLIQIRISGLLIVILCQLLSLNQISARPNNLHEERREYQFQQLSKLVFPPSYRNEMDRQTDQRMIAENVQSQWQNRQNTALATTTTTSNNNDQFIQRQRANCISRCDQSIGQLDLLAQDITSQITRELETGQLTRAQMSVPNWYENRVRQKYSELQTQHNHQYQQNVYEASKHLRIEDSNNNNDNQQAQENIFGSDDLRQVQQTLFNQRQYQQQGQHFQEQSQNQQHIIYTKPVLRTTDQRTTYVNHEHEIMRQQPPPSYVNSQIDTNRSTTNEERQQTTNYVRPTQTPTTTIQQNQFNSINEEINNSEHTATNPKLTIYNRYGDVEDLGQVTESIGGEEQPLYPSREYQRNNTHTIRVHWRPMELATEPSIQTTNYNRRDEETTDIEEEEQRQTTYRHQPTEPITINRQQNEERFTTTDDEEHYRTTVVEIYTPRPIPNTGIRHNIYNRLDDQETTIEVETNYQPRVRVNNTDFQILDHKREQVTATDDTRHPSRSRTTIIDTLTENEYLDRLDIVRNQFTRWGYPQQTLTVYNSTINDGCIKHNDQIYIYSPKLRLYKKYDEHSDGELVTQPHSSYYTWNPQNPDRRSNEYKERMRITINQFQRWDYPQQTESVYLSAIRNGFVHDGQRYIYNADSKRYERIDGEQIYNTARPKYPERTIEETLYETRTMTLRQDLAMNGLDQLRPDEFNRTISTGRFEKSGIRFIFNSITDHFEPILENSLTGSQDNSYETVPVPSLTTDEYKQRLKIIKNQFALWGYPAMKDTLYNMTINCGYFILNNNKYVYDDESKNYVIKYLTSNSNDQHRPNYPALDRSILRTTNEQYLDRLRQTENQFTNWGHQPQLVNDHIFISTLSNGYVHNGYRYLYNPETRQYDQYNLDDLSRMKLQSKPNDYTETDRYIQAIDLRHDIAINGLMPLEESEYESVIAVKRIEKNGLIFEYNEQTGHYEKIIEHKEEFSGPQHLVLNMSPEEYLERLRITQKQFATWHYPVLQMYIYNSTIASGGFTHMGYRYLYNPDKKVYEQKYRVENAEVYNQNAGSDRRDTELDEDEDDDEQVVQQHVQPTVRYQIQPFHHHGSHETIVKLTDEEYHQRLQELHNEIHRLGFDSHGEQYSQTILNQTIENGGFNSPDGYRYIFNTNRQRYEKMGRIDQTNEEVLTIRQHQLADKLRSIDNDHKFEQMTQQEINQTLTTGVFIRGGNKYLYNSDTERYEQIKINDDEKQRIFDRVQQILKQLNFRQISNRECQKIFQNGKIIRGGHHWLYNSLSGTLQKDEYVGEFAELSSNEYEDIYRKIQAELRRLGYAQMTAGQCNSTITTGKFERGGIYFIYDAEKGIFERQPLTQSENRDRLNVLRYELNNIKHRNLSDKEYRAIVSKGYFQHGGYRYEYNTKTGKFERTQMTQEEYMERIMELRNQLNKIGYERMTESECKSIINRGTFNFGGYEWLYNYETGRYEQGERSKIDQSINVNKLPSNTMEFDRTTYESTIPAAAQSTDDQQVQQHHRQQQPENERPRRPEISKNRGDQPPQHIFDDYESSEELLEQEPNIGYYPTGQIRVTTLPSTIHRTEMVPFDAENQQEQHQKVNSGQLSQTSVNHKIEHRYHRTQTNYVQESSVPLYFASQNTLPDEINEEVDDGLPDPYPTDAYTTQVYTVGSNVDIRTTTPSYPKRRSPYDKGQTVQKSDKLEDFGETDEKSKVIDDEQQKQSFNFNYNTQPNEEDLDGQRLVGPESDNLQNKKNLLSVEDTFIRNLQQRYQTQSTTRETQQHQSPTYRRQQQNQPEDLTQQNINLESDKYNLRPSTTGDNSQRPEDLTQQYVDPKVEQLYDPTANNEYQQHQESEDLRKLHEQYIAGQLQNTDDLSQQQQQTVEINGEQNSQSTNVDTENINNTDEEAKVIEVTTKKPGFWNRLGQSISQVFTQRHKRGTSGKQHANLIEDLNSKGFPPCSDAECDKIILAGKYTSSNGIDVLYFNEQTGHFEFQKDDSTTTTTPTTIKPSEIQIQIVLPNITTKEYIKHLKDLQDYIERNLDGRIKTMNFYNKTIASLIAIEQNCNLTDNINNDDLFHIAIDNIFDPSSCKSISNVIDEKINRNEEQTVQISDKFGETYEKSKVIDDDQQNKEDLDSQGLVGPTLQQLYQIQTSIRESEQSPPTCRRQQQNQPEDLTQQNINLELNNYNVQSRFGDNSNNQRPEDLRQQFVDSMVNIFYVLTANNEHQQQRQESEDLRKLHEQYIAGQFQTTVNLSKQQQTVEINERNSQSINVDNTEKINNTDEEAKVIEVTTKKPGFWNRFRNKIFG